jgi:hypothetical protein
MLEKKILFQAKMRIYSLTHAPFVTPLGKGDAVNAPGPARQRYHANRMAEVEQVHLAGTLILT